MVLTYILVKCSFRGNIFKCVLCTLYIDKQTPMRNESSILSLKLTY